MRRYSKSGLATMIVAGALVAIAIVAAVGAYFFLLSGGGNSTGGGSFTYTGSPQNLNAGGSSFVNPVMQTWIFQFTNITRGAVTINYLPVGSGAGQQGILAGTLDYAGSDAPMSPAQLANASGRTLLQIPESLGAVVIFYNIPEIGNVSMKLTGPVLAGIWKQTITNWDDPAIAALNPGLALPHKAIVPVHRSDGSGTTYAFATYLSKVDPTWNSTIGVGTTVNWPTSELAAKGSAGVAGLVYANAYAVGYVDQYYAQANGLPAAFVQNSAGNFVAPTLDSVTSAASDFAGQLQLQPTLSITDAPGANSYPISTFTYILVWRDQPDTSKGFTMASFFWYVIHQGQRYGPHLFFPTLPPGIVTVDEGLIRQMNSNGRAFIG